MDCVETPGSTTMVRFCYNARRQMLTVQFRHGAVYNYYEVPESIFQKMTLAPSKGAFLTQEVKGRYHYERLEDSAKKKSEAGKG